MPPKFALTEQLLMSGAPPYRFIPISGTCPDV
jgi:hypothetical protein